MYRYFSTCTFVYSQGYKTVLRRNWYQDGVCCGQCYKAVYSRKLQIFVVSYSVCPWQTSLMFAGKVRIVDNLKGASLFLLEKLARDKRSSLLQKVVTYGCKSFITLAPGVLVYFSLIFAVKARSQPLEWSTLSRLQHFHTHIRRQ